jgi:hypothetical protein
MNKKVTRMLNYNINRISERDIDLLIIEEFAASKKFAALFLQRLSLEEYNILSISHSVMHSYLGESDITIVLRVGNQRLAVLIENKISAIAMPQQYQRYVERGQEGIRKGEYDRFDVFITAPNKYLSSNNEAQKYPYAVPYELMLEYFDKNEDIRSQIKSTLLEQAIERAKVPYQVIPNESVTLFWNQYIDYVKQHFYDLAINDEKKDRGSKSSWPIFITSDKRVKIRHKADRGIVDLEFSGLAKSYLQLKPYLETYLLKGFTVGTTGKSLAIRTRVPELDFMSDFSLQNDVVHQCLESVREMYVVMNKIDLNKVFEG